MLATRFLTGLLAGCLLSATAARAQEAADSAESSHPTEAQMPQTVQDGSTVALNYTLTVDGAVVDSSTTGDPLTYVQGEGNIIPGLERQLAGLSVGDTRDITVGPNEAYGEVDPAAYIEVPKAQLPKDITPEIGTLLRGTDPEGHPFRATVHEVKNQTVTLDLNHPLAGKTLQFQVEVVTVTPPQ